MATDFWASSHYKRWIVDRATLRQARAEDLQYVEDPEYFDLLNIFFANVISKLGKKLQLRQRVVATATMFFKRFYLKNSYCETDPFIVIAACCYVAAKAEESPVHIKNVVTEARLLFGGKFSSHYGIKTFPSDNSKLAEMEFYLVDDLECDLVVFHPYRSLMTLCGKPGNSAVLEAEAGELGVGIQDGSQSWGTGEGRLELQEGALQTAWFIINDTFRSDLCLLYPPHLIAITAIYLTLVIHSSTRDSIGLHSSDSSSGSNRRSPRSSHSHSKKPTQDIVGFMAGLNVSMEIIASIAQEIICQYTLWERYKEEKGEASARGSFATELQSSMSSGLKRTASGQLRAASVARSRDGTPVDSTQRIVGRTRQPAVVTPAFLAQLLIRMREAKMADMAHPATGRPMALDKRLERAQNA
ncbi:cyclin-like protein [Irpex rosettiformis]|uniref:Cyclin-like protein n=1 Tax=Irpex rosettiformis TaxID=378272 RepID=A0ACB8TQ39_9APHY|nr:cyclin-like protein [Irpex rosettiformis]